MSTSSEFQDDGRRLINEIDEVFGQHSISPEAYMDQYYGKPIADIVPQEMSAIKKALIGSAIGAIAISVGFAAWYYGTQFVEAYKYLHH